MKQWYEALFENYARKYDKECFVQGTVGECDFIEAEAGQDKSLKIIDIGCGTGRHAIELAKRGYKVSGVDLSESQLSRAREKAKEAGVAIDFKKHDARVLPFEGEGEAGVHQCGCNMGCYRNTICCVLSFEAQNRVFQQTVKYRVPEDADRGERGALDISPATPL
jgi:SAM-dependent methyltransferase